MLIQLVRTPHMQFFLLKIYIYIRKFIILWEGNKKNPPELSQPLSFPSLPFIWCVFSRCLAVFQLGKELSSPKSETSLSTRTHPSLTPALKQLSHHGSNPSWVSLCHSVLFFHTQATHLILRSMRLSNHLLKSQLVPPLSLCVCVKVLWRFYTCM